MYKQRIADALRRNAGVVCKRNEDLVFSSKMQRFGAAWAVQMKINEGRWASAFLVQMCAGENVRCTGDVRENCQQTRCGEVQALQNFGQRKEGWCCEGSAADDDTKHVFHI